MTTRYPSSWQNIRLSDCCTRVTRKNKAGISLVLTASGEFGLVDQREFFNKQVAPKNLSGYYHLKKGEFAYNRSSMKGYPYGAIKRLDRYEDGALSTLYLCFKVSSSDADPCYMEHLFESSLLDLELQPIARVGARAHGLLNVTPGEFMDIQLCLPPLPEQKKIAAILSSVDETIQATRETIEQTKKVKQGLMQELLTRGIGHTRFKKTEIGEIPEDWEALDFRSVCSWIGVGIACSATQAYSITGVPLLRNQNILDGSLDTSDLLYISKEFDSQNASKRLMTGDVITMRTGYPGRSAVVDSSFNDCHTFTTLISRPMQQLIAPSFLCHWLNSPLGKRLVKSRQAGGAQQNLNVSILRKMPVPVPSLSEQHRICEIIDAVVSRIEEAETGLEQLQLLKKGLMQDLLTGKVRVAV